MERMKRFTILNIIVLFFLGSVGLMGHPITKRGRTEKMLENVQWLGHASVKIRGKTTVYVDPFKLKGGETADLILITHDHYDHLSMEDIQLIQDENTVIVVPPDGAAKLKGNVKTVKPGDKIKVGDVDIEVVPAYNIGKRFHPQDQAHVGYVFTVDGIRYYHAGDTDHIPEMKGLKPDVAFLPVGGTYTMNAEEAAAATNDIEPQIAVPMHWGSIVGSKKDAEKFMKLCECDVHILLKEK